jgi:hypothetical protein
VVHDVTNTGNQTYNGNLTTGSTYTTNGGNFTVTGTTTLGNSSTINTGGGSVTLTGAVSGDGDANVETLTINGASTLTMNNPGNTNLGSINLANVGPVLISYTGNLVLNADTLVNGGTIQSTGNMELTAGTPNPGSLVPGPAGQNLILDTSGNVLLGGTASQWSLNGSTSVPLSNFFAVTPGTGVTVGTQTAIAGAADLFSTSVAASGQASAVAAAADEAANTFGTDSVAEQVEYGFAGDVGVLPPMDHRLRGVGISVPKCFNESREGESCD